MGQRKMLVASYSDAADSAVSMVSWHVVVQYFSVIVICSVRDIFGGLNIASLLVLTGS